MLSSATGALLVADLLEVRVRGRKTISQEHRRFVAYVRPPCVFPGIPHVIAADSQPFRQTNVGRISASVLENEQVSNGHVHVGEIPGVVMRQIKHDSGCDIEVSGIQYRLKHETRGKKGWRKFQDTHVTSAHDGQNGLQR